MILFSRADIVAEAFRTADDQPIGQSKLAVDNVAARNRVPRHAVS